jgi:hypothetical protein
MTKPKSQSNRASPDPETGEYHLDPIIDGMLERLPAPGDPWAVEERKLWLEILEKVFELIYPEDAPLASTPDDPPRDI